MRQPADNQQTAMPLQLVMSKQQYERVPLSVTTATRPKSACGSKSVAPSEHPIASTTSLIAEKMSSMPSNPTNASTTNDEEVQISTSSKKSGAKGSKKKGKKGKKTKAIKLPKDMITNDRGEVITTREYTLEKTLDATTKSLRQIQDRMESLVRTNEELNETLQQQEKDALEVIAALHRESEAKDLKIKALQDKLAEEDVLAKKSREAVVEDCDRKIAEMNAILTEKEAAFKVMQQEFSVIKDFRRKRHELMKDLEYQKIELTDTDKRHKDVITRLERKFFEEKIRLQKEANRKISELAAKAHKEAVMNLKETTKEVYKENIRMAEALRHHVQEGEELTKANTELVQTNRKLSEEKDLHNVIVKEKIMQTKLQEQEIKELKLKIASMEHSLSHVVREFEHEREIIGNLARKELDDVREVAERLRASLARKTIEMKHIKRLAQHILDQRSELEQYFLDSLETIKAEVRKAREKSLKTAMTEYNQKMRSISFEKGAPVPPIQSFRPHATNLRGEALAMALVEEGTSSTKYENKAKVDIKDLTWEDKERVLRILFAKMNGTSLTKAAEDAERARDQLKAYRGNNNLGSSGFTRGMDREVDIDDYPDADAIRLQLQAQVLQAQPDIAPQAEENNQVQSSDLVGTIAAMAAVGPNSHNDSNLLDLDGSHSYSAAPRDSIIEESEDIVQHKTQPRTSAGLPLFVINDVETESPEAAGTEKFSAVAMPAITIGDS